MGRFAGFSLYVSTADDGLQRSSLCYKDGPELPPLNFTTVCIKSGRYVTFYNKRLDEVKYPEGYQLVNVFTELCEVVVEGKFINFVWLYINYLINALTLTKSIKTNGVLLLHLRYPLNIVGFSDLFFDDDVQNLMSCCCFFQYLIYFDRGCTKPGVYGNSCNIPCPIHCKNDDCNIQNGTCYQCDPGWEGTTCQISIVTVLCYSYNLLRGFCYRFFFHYRFLLLKSKL